MCGFSINKYSINMITRFADDIFLFQTSKDVACVNHFLDEILQIKIISDSRTFFVPEHSKKNINLNHDFCPNKLRLKSSHFYSIETNDEIFFKKVNHKFSSNQHKLFVLIIKNNKTQKSNENMSLYIFVK